MSENPAKPATQSPSPTFCVVERASSSTAGTYRSWRYIAAASPGRGSSSPVSGGPTGSGETGRRYRYS